MFKKIICIMCFAVSFAVAHGSVFGSDFQERLPSNPLPTKVEVEVQTATPFLAPQEIKDVKTEQPQIKTGKSSPVLSQDLPDSLEQIEGQLPKSNQDSPECQQAQLSFKIQPLKENLDFNFTKEAVFGPMGGGKTKWIFDSLQRAADSSTQKTGMISEPYTTKFLFITHAFDQKEGAELGQLASRAYPRKLPADLVVQPSTDLRKLGAYIAQAFTLMTAMFENERSLNNKAPAPTLFIEVFMDEVQFYDVDQRIAVGTLADKVKQEIIAKKTNIPVKMVLKCTFCGLLHDYTLKRWPTSQYLLDLLSQQEPTLLYARCSATGNQNGKYSILFQQGTNTSTTDHIQQAVLAGKATVKEGATNLEGPYGSLNALWTLIAGAQSTDPTLAKQEFLERLRYEEGEDFPKLMSTIQESYPQVYKKAVQLLK